MLRDLNNRFVVFGSSVTAALSALIVFGGPLGERSPDLVRQDPVGVLSAGLQQKVNVPGWIAVPRRSTKAYAVSVPGKVPSGRITYRTLLSSGSVNAFYTQALALHGLPLMTLVPGNYAPGLGGVHIASDPTTGREVVIVVRNGRHVRKVEIKYRGGQSRQIASTGNL